MQKGLSFLSKIKDFSLKYEPEILTGLGIAGFITTAVMSAYAALSARQCIENEKKRLSKKEGLEVVELTKKEEIRASIKSYIPPIIVGLASTGCIIGGMSIKHKRYSALATAFAVTEAAAKNYQEKVIEMIGKRKEETIRNEIVDSKISNDERPINQKNVIITQCGKMRCYDCMSDRYFESDIEKIKRAVNELNYRMRSDMYISLNEFYDEIDLPETTLGNILGWNIDHGYIELDYSSHLSPDTVPCLAIDFSKASPPIPNFMNI